MVYLSKIHLKGIILIYTKQFNETVVVVLNMVFNFNISLTPDVLDLVETNRMFQLILIVFSVKILHHQGQICW